MLTWEQLLPPLTEVPRENGSDGLREAAAWLVQTLEGAGLDVTTIPFPAQPYRLRLAGVVALLGAVLYAWCIRARRPVLALGVAVVLPAALLLELDAYVPVFGWIGAQPAHHVAVRLPAERAEQRLVLTAHYDTKTDLLDHVERAPVEWLGVPVTLLMIVGALVAARAGRRRRGARRLPRLTAAAAVLAVVYGLAMFASLSAGAFVSRRSPGALDNGAACAVLARLAEQLKANGPLPRTDVEMVFLAGEEAGVQGSWEYARQRFAKRPDVPTAVINLEFIGATPNFAVFGKEAFSLRTYRPDPTLVALLDSVHRAQRRKPLYVTWYGAGTDARSFLAHGVPAVTLVSDLPAHALPRHLHSAADDRARLDPAALDGALAFLDAVVRAADQRGTIREAGRPAE